MSEGTGPDIAAGLMKVVRESAARDISGQVDNYFERCSTSTNPQEVKNLAQQLVQQIETTRKAAAVAVEVIKLTYGTD